MGEKKVVEIFDVSETAFLLCKGFEMSKSVWKNNRIVFELNGDKDHSELLNEFYTHKARVSPLRFFNEVKNLKALIYNEKKKRGVIK